MPVKNFTRRTFVAAAGSAPALAAENQVAPKPAGGPIKIVTMYKFEPEEVRRIQAATPAAIELVIAGNRQQYRTLLREADVVYGEIAGAELDYAPKLKWVQSGGAGMEGMAPELKTHPAVVTNYARIFAPGISETGIGMLLCLTRGITTHYMPQFAKRQMKPVGNPKSADHTELVGRTMAIVGMGGIGSFMARRAHYGFDMKIIATDARPIPKPEYVDELHSPDYFPDLVPRADVLVAAAPLTPTTERMFNESVFRSMKKTAYFLALSRGRLFDDMALVKALKQGWIAGAGLDVFPQEPPPSEHPIFDLPNVVMTAHTSGWSPDRQVRLIDFFAENVRRYAAGLPLVNVVDKQAGY
ncbi:D-2-hydroxyacid dehydrogenase [Paludibaculum fermentans]|uniref:D-2-hydroxyacid dehydrogenase n=1 Tax=Paludibaculum fermentans TaxID=1473598 RepID=A0A7S7SMA7_PALFE|nr:D-2-hydroxyacid dehydrogenase [Paludibaculum fermentans]QOY90249.1 D-2-hydroxyacid dehydrogenase [Paludibaculum fermentans]